MRKWALELLRCPRTGRPLEMHGYAQLTDARADLESGTLITSDGSHSYPIINGIPRFVAPDNYARSFGLQWNRFRQSQLDSHSGQPISRDRFLRYSGWNADMLRGKVVLDVGCGAGRFTEIALASGARVVALDYSSAVEACRVNHGQSAELLVVQGDLYELPFAPGSFDFVYCFGVLQHTPDVHAAFRALPPMLRANGRLAVDIYPRLWQNALWPKYWLRPVTKRLPPSVLLRILQRTVPLMLPVSGALARIPGFGRRLRYFIPVANYEFDYPLSREQLAEWALLDTFDMLAARHDEPQTLDTLRRWFEEAGLQDVEVERVGFNVGRGKAAAAAVMHDTMAMSTGQQSMLLPCDSPMGAQAECAHTNR